MAKSKLSGTKSVALKSPPRRKKTSASRSIETTASLYSVHPGVTMAQRWTSELKIKTGRSLDDWIRHIKSAGPATENDCRGWLKSAYLLGTNTAAWLAAKAFSKPLGLAETTPERYLALAPVYVEQMYAGPKAVLRPLHDELIKFARQLGDQIRICPCQTIVPLYRRHVFAQIKPATTKRIELGFALGEEPFTARLRDTGGNLKKDRITHSVAITALGDIDLQVKRWLKQAFERDA